MLVRRLKVLSVGRLFMLSTLVLCAAVATASAQSSSSASYQMDLAQVRPAAGAADATGFYSAEACVDGGAGGLSTSTSFRLQAGCGSSFVLGLDYGDAPSSTYPTLRADDGARHLLATSLCLGSAVDAELDAPAGTDTADDGVSFYGDLAPGANNVDVTVSRAGLLDAWIDFNDDGDWDDSGEQIFASQAVSSGLNTLQFSVPSPSTTGLKVARFRVSSAGGLASTGFAADGEVEDYEVSTVPVELLSFTAE